MFETLVALDTDRAGLRALAAASSGVVLTGWLASLVERRWSGDEFSAALMERKRIVNATWRFMERFDFLLTPTTAAPAFPIDLDGPAQIDGRAVPPTAWIAFSALANLTGLPAASVPDRLHRRRPADRPADHGPPPRRSRRAGAGRGGRVAVSARALA